MAIFLTVDCNEASMCWNCEEIWGKRKEVFLTHFLRNVWGFFQPRCEESMCWNSTGISSHLACEENGHLQWDVCKSPGFPSNRVAAGQVDPPAVRITMVCSLFACRLSASEAFLFLSGVVCWVFSNAYTKLEHLLVFPWLVIGEGPELLDAEGHSSIAPLRRGTCRRSKSQRLQASTTYLLDSKFTFVCMHNFSLVVRCVLQTKPAQSIAQVSNG